MTALTNTLENLNFLSPLNFQFSLQRAPHINWFIQKTNIPSVMVPAAVQLTPFTNEPWGGLKPQYGDFELSFKLDENLLGYIELYIWLMSYSDPDNGDDYATLSANPDYTGKGLKSDMSLIILDQLKNPIYRIEIVDAFPTGLSAVQVNTTDSTVNYITCTALFKFRRFYIRPIVGSVDASTDVPTLSTLVP